MTPKHLRLPYAETGMRIGLFGGSFNPPHEGHVHVSEIALKRGELDQIWWLVTPGNPLKDHSNLAPLEERIHASEQITENPAIRITGFEALHNVRFTADTLEILKRIRPRLKFVWIMGADNLAGFHKWQNWRTIAAQMPLMVIDRPGSTLSYLSAPAALSLWRYRVDEEDAALLADVDPPAWTFVHAPRNHLSSTQLRRLRKNRNMLDT